MSDLNSVYTNDIEERETINRSPEVIDLDDASTEVNFSLSHLKSENFTQIYHNESKATEPPRKKPRIGSIGYEDGSYNRKQQEKSYSSNYYQLEETTKIEESEWWITQSWLNPESQDFLRLSSSNQARLTRVFLLGVVPDIYAQPLNLVSGYCHHGCQGLTLFSDIHWVHKEKISIPTCHHCFKNENKEEELQLAFILKLIVMDVSGCNGVLHLCSEPAEDFFGCSVKDFLSDTKLRQNKIKLLKQRIVHENSDYTPPLDIFIVAIKDNLFAAYSKPSTAKPPLCSLLYKPDLRESCASLQ